MKNVYLTLFVLLLITSCTNVSENDLIEPIIIEPNASINYIEHIKPILENNCNFCHSNPPVNGATNSLITYNNVVNAVNNANLIDLISREVGETGAMPFGGPKLPQNLIDLIIQWETDGLLEN